MRQVYLKRQSIFLGILFSVSLAACSTSTPKPPELEAQAVQTLRLSPVSYLTLRGADGAQAVANLNLKDQAGTQNNWNRYVEFQTPNQNYVGYRRYTLPAGISPQSLTGLKVEANFLGPNVQAQQWRWRIFNWKTNSWVYLGNNNGSSWSGWKLLSFSASGTAADYVKTSTSEIRIRSDSSNASDDADLDYEAILLSYQTDAPPTRSWWQAQKGLKWWWQIENTASLNTNLAVDVYDIDLFEGSETGKISALKSKGYKVICYFSAGTFEPWRPDAAQLFANNAQAIIAGSALPQFQDEAWLNIGNAQALETIIKPVMRARLELAKNAACDAVEPDNVDGFDNSETQGKISSAQQVTYNKWLASEAHARGLGVGLKNALSLIPNLQNDFDFAVNEQCFAYGNECTLYETTFLAANKAVFNQEYAYTPADDGSIGQTAYLNQVCPYFKGQGISSLWKQGLNLNGNAVTPCN
jgi:hypothetical protein